MKQRDERRGDVVMPRANPWLIVGCGLLGILFGVMLVRGFRALTESQIRVLCQDERLGRLSHDFDRRDVIETPCGWVLHYPQRPEGQRTELWQSCTVNEI